MNNNGKSFSTRRRQLLAVAGGAAVTMSPLAVAALAGEQAARLRVGIVLPQSNRFPDLSLRTLEGFQSFAATPAGRVLQLVPIAVDRGPVAALDAATRAVEGARVDVLAGIVDRNRARRLAPVLEANGVPFVVSDMGADIVRNHRESAFLVRNSLGYWQSCFAMGEWSAGNLGTRALIAADFLESGHDMVYAFRHGFERAGGEILDVKVTGIPDGTAGFAKAGDAIRSQRPDFVFAFYSGKRADAFLHYYESEGLSHIAQLAGPALLTDAASSTGILPSARAGIVTASTWAPDLDAPLAREFQATHRSIHGGDPGVFAMLGYETAQRIATSFEAAGRDRSRLPAALHGTAFEAPRGEVAALDGMAEHSSPVYVRRLTHTANGLENLTIAALPPIDLQGSRGELRAMTKTGWAHAYLAA